MKFFILNCLFLMGVFNTELRAQTYASSGQNKTKLALYVVNADGFVKKVAGGKLLSRAFGKSATFTVTPSQNSYFIAGKKDQTTLAKASFSYYLSEWGYKESWKFETALTASQVSEVIKTVCKKRCLKKNEIVGDVLKELANGDTQKVFPIKSSYSAYHGDRVGWSDRENLPVLIKFPTKNKENVILEIKFKKNWKLY
jgi:hypothetical protein